MTGGGPERLFVYGKLRRSPCHPMHKLLVLHAEFLGPAQTRGRIYDAGGYPGAVPSSHEKDRIRGELYRLLRPRLVLPRLDAYECCGPDAPAPFLYRRERLEVILADGRTVQAWAYLYNRPVEHLPRIHSGDFLQP